MVKIKFTSRFTKTIGDHISWDTTMMASLVNKYRWKIAIRRAFNSFCVTDSQTDFIICPMLLMHWADNNFILTWNHD